MAQKIHGNVLHSQGRGNFSQKKFKGKKLFMYIITATHDNLLSCYRAPLVGADFCYHAIALGVHIIGGFVTCLDKFVYKCRSN